MPGEQQDTTEARTDQERVAARQMAAALIAAHRLLGRESKVLANDESGLASNDRAATLRRKQGLLSDASRHLAGAVSSLASVVGLQELGVDGQYPQDASGEPYKALYNLESLDSDLFSSVFEELHGAMRALRKVYTPTRKHPDLAYPEDRAAMSEVVTHLRTASTLLKASFNGAEDGEEDEGDEVDLLAELEQICEPLPAQQGEMSDEAVIARVLSDPRLAAKTAKALRSRKLAAGPAEQTSVR
ncbi:hypothetical protein ACIQI7_32465 [Kitasatospora sp. NPDC092039]|uniref:hypothetical protein n=1 Tax=Kitasatospora sp. NPDC092039 TaxID=3364086 RepID=UPI003810B7A1